MLSGSPQHVCLLLTSVQYNVLYEHFIENPAARTPERSGNILNVSFEMES